MYSFTIADRKDVCKKAKGMKKIVVKRTITHDDYLDCLFHNNTHYRTMNTIRSHLHNVYSERVNKIALSADDDKRCIMEDGISTLSYGHYRLND